MPFPVAIVIGKTKPWSMSQAELLSKRLWHPLKRTQRTVSVAAQRYAVFFRFFSRHCKDAKGEKTARKLTKLDVKELGFSRVFLCFWAFLEMK